MKTFETKTVVNCPPEELYLALVRPFAVSIWTGETAVMSDEPGSEFELWGGDICGRNRCFEPDRYIEQEWYFEEEEDETETPEERKSIVAMRLYPHGATKTKLCVRHTNIPDEAFDDIKYGWLNVYLPSVKAFIEEGE